MAKNPLLGAGLVGVVCVALALGGGTAALAAKPDKSPLEAEPLTLPGGLACEFDVQLSPEPGSKFSQKEFSDGRFVVTGSGHDRVTNLDEEKSIVLHTSGKAAFVPVSETETGIELSGHNIVYLFPGDEGPFGTVGEPGALYIFEGRVSEILDLEANVITSFRWSGHVTELCSLVS